MQRRRSAEASPTHAPGIRSTCSVFLPKETSSRTLVMLISSGKVNRRRRSLAFLLLSRKLVEQGSFDVDFVLQRISPSRHIFLCGSPHTQARGGQHEFKRNLQACIRVCLKGLDEASITIPIFSAWGWKLPKLVQPLKARRSQDKVVTVNSNKCR